MIILKSQDEIKRIAESCRIVSEALEGIKKIVAPGVTTLELNKFAESFIASKNATPAFKGYKGYPASLCTSINEQVVHGIPSLTKLKEGARVEKNKEKRNVMLSPALGIKLTVHEF